MKKKKKPRWGTYRKKSCTFNNVTVTITDIVTVEFTIHDRCDYSKKINQTPYNYCTNR